MEAEGAARGRQSRAHAGATCRSRARRRCGSASLAWNTQTRAWTACGSKPSHGGVGRAARRAARRLACVRMHKCAQAGGMPASQRCRRQSLLTLPMLPLPVAAYTHTHAHTHTHTHTRTHTRTHTHTHTHRYIRERDLDWAYWWAVLRVPCSLPGLSAPAVEALRGCMLRCTCACAHACGSTRGRKGRGA
jgi:ABC-type nickel/cobalt efflux system permease component RcnA